MGEVAGQGKEPQASGLATHEPSQLERHSSAEGPGVLWQGRGFGIVPGQKAEDLDRGGEDFS